MDQILWWLLLAVSMFGGSFLAGMVPLIVVSMSESKMRSVSAFGGGLLVGTVLTVVIPEGIETLFSALENESAKHEKEDASHLIALSLLFGFGMMFIIDQFSAFLGSEAYHNHSKHFHPVSSDISIQMNQIHNGRVVNSANRTQNHHKSSATGSAFLGVIVHCMADGVAMAAASFSKQDNLEMLVFMAIILHKVPTAFGLSSYMLASGNHSKRYIKRALVIFSLSAPLSFVSTLYILGLMTLDPYQTQLWTGLLLLFSAGSFLYVAAVHVLPEIKENINEEPHNMEDYASPKVALSSERLASMSFDLKQPAKRFNHAIALNTFFITIGMFLPLLLSSSSGHHHH